jgi:type III pantothenate kinase
MHRWHFETDLRRSAAWCARQLARPLRKFGRAQGAVYASVVPAFNGRLESALRAACGARVLAVDARSPLGLTLQVKAPGQVGADRILNALALKARGGGPAIAIDIGTAITFDCLDRESRFIGGAILAGPGSCARALHEFTAQLPLIAPKKAARAIGRDTASALESGLYFGAIGMIREMLRRTKAELGGRPAVVVTGGLAALFVRDIPKAELAPDLTLQGLRQAYEILHHGAGL